ncbi:MAG TPA: TlpA disulfide reductase family protein [Candidatus Acidoferrales bacterium]|nr:TlpA disulfide reductase family protein [Candidatus Acidoferrales bacterium]
MAARRLHKLLETGARAPEFRLPLLDGGEAGLQELRARGPVLLAFFKITCPVCQMTFPFLERIHAAGTHAAGTHAAGTLRIYGISQNDPADTREFNLEFGVTFPTLLDTEESGFPVSNDYGIASVPTLFLVEPTGTLSFVSEGWSRKEIAWLANKSASKSANQSGGQLGNQSGSQAGVSVFRPGDNVPEWKPG